VRALVAALILAAGTGFAPRVEHLDCVTPKATVTGTVLHRTWINVYTKPSPRATVMSYTIASPLPLWVIGRSGSFLHVTTGDDLPNWPFKPRTDLGWVRASDVAGQAIRNCT
jgi:hypothetical protein